jgi:hypothetical protein
MAPWYLGWIATVLVLPPFIPKRVLVLLWFYGCFDRLYQDLLHQTYFRF